MSLEKAPVETTSSAGLIYDQSPTKGLTVVLYTVESLFLCITSPEGAVIVASPTVCPTKIVAVDGGVFIAN